VSSMIGNAQAESLATANNIDFHSEVYSSEKQAAKAFGISGRYLGFEASATGQVDRTATTNVVVAQFVQQMYIAGVTQPSTPASVFSADFTSAKYKEQADLGRIGADNPPLYVSRIGFGRMMVFSMSANAEASEIKGALNAAYTGIGSKVGVQLSSQQSAILRNADIRITQVGGDQNNALSAIRSGNLADYFTNTAPLTSAEPLWFELKTLTGETALVSEPGSYTQTTCKPKLPGTFDYRPEQAMSIPFTAGTQRQTVQADVNGDGRMDLVFNERRTGPALNRVHVALANSDGTFTLEAPADNPNDPAEGWENYTLLVADIDGDGRDDLVWNTLGAANVVYSAMTNGDGSFVWRDRQQHLNNGWTGFKATTGDLNGDGKTDILWSNAGSSSSALRTYFGLAQPDSSFSMITNFVDQSGDYSGYSPPVTANFDGAKGDDFVVNALSATYNNSHVALFSPTSPTTGTLAFPPAVVYTSDGWDTYTMRVGDIDGQHGADLVFVSTTFGAIHRAINNGSGTFAIQPYQNDGLKTGPIEPFVADFNNDGRADLLMVHRTASLNELAVGFGLADGKFSFPAGTQTHPATPAVGWLPFQIFVGDVNGDGKADVVWTNPSSDAHVFVALSK
ncbi:MAG TPA: FG-GAP-like repeat-containing protein, partial [Gemmatimonadaceae bacterium]